MAVGTQHMVKASEKQQYKNENTRMSPGTRERRWLKCVIYLNQINADRKRRYTLKQKRIKSGLAVTERHLKMIDENLRRAGAGSRNDFVEKAVEFYVGHLNAEDSSQYIGELLSQEVDKRLSQFTKTFSTNQYKTSVQLSVLCHLLASEFRYNHAELETLTRHCKEEVKRLDSVPSFGQISKREDNRGEIL